MPRHVSCASAVSARRSGDRLFTTLIASRIVRGHVRHGRVPAWPAPAFSRRMPRGLGLRGTVLGIACIVAVGIPTTRLLTTAGVDEMSSGGFAAALAIVVTPFVARLALGDPS
jgi:hypothetical protein